MLAFETPPRFVWALLAALPCAPWAHVGRLRSLLRSSFERPLGTGSGGAGGAHFGSCGAQWDAHVPSDRPLLPIRACCGVRVRDVRLSKSLGVGHLIPLPPHDL